MKQTKRLSRVLCAFSIVVLILLPIVLHQAAALGSFQWNGTLQLQFNGSYNQAGSSATFGASGTDTFGFNVSNQGSIAGAGSGPFVFSISESYQYPSTSCVVPQTQLPFSVNDAITGTVANGQATLVFAETSTTLAASITATCTVTNPDGSTSTTSLPIPLPPSSGSGGTGSYTITLQDGATTTTPISVSASGVQASGQTTLTLHGHSAPNQQDQYEINDLQSTYHANLQYAVTSDNFACTAQLAETNGVCASGLHLLFSANGAIYNVGLTPLWEQVKGAAPELAVKGTQKLAVGLSGYFRLVKMALPTVTKVTSRLLPAVKAYDLGKDAYELYQVLDGVGGTHEIGPITVTITTLPSVTAWLSSGLTQDYITSQMNQLQVFQLTPGTDASQLTVTPGSACTTDTPQGTVSCTFPSLQSLFAVGIPEPSPSPTPFTTIILDAFRSAYTLIGGLPSVLAIIAVGVIASLLAHRRRSAKKP